MCPIINPMLCPCRLLWTNSSGAAPQVHRCAEDSDYAAGEGVRERMWPRSG